MKRIVLWSRHFKLHAIDQSVTRILRFATNPLYTPALALIWVTQRELPATACFQPHSTRRAASGILSKHLPVPHLRL